MSPGDLGRDLERLPGVLAATVFPDSPGGARVYLAVEDGLDHHAIRATVFALLRDRGFEADADRVHIGTAPSRPTTPAPLPPLSLDALDVRRTGNKVECTVHVRVQRRIHTASAVEPDTPTGPARAAARATLAAVQTLDPDLRLGLHGIRRHDLLGFDALIVLVEGSIGRTQIQLPGIVLLERSLEHAAALATLRALRSWTP